MEYENDADILKYKAENTAKVAEIKAADSNDLKNLIAQNKQLDYPERVLSEEELFSEDEDFYIDE